MPAKIEYLHGYNPSETIEVYEVRANRSVGGPAWLELLTTDGEVYEATHLLFKPNGKLQAVLPENW